MFKGIKLGFAGAVGKIVSAQFPSDLGLPAIRAMLAGKNAANGRQFLTALLVLFLSLCFSGAALAQATTGILKGRVVDESGNAVVGQSVSITSPLTGQSLTLTTSNNGRFQVQLVPGDYSLFVQGSGFTSVRVERVSVAVGATVELSIPVTARSMEEVIVFGQATPLMHTSVGESGMQISLEEIEQLPVERNIEAVALLAPGTTPGINRFSDYISFGGSSVAENAYYIDGLNVTNFLSGVGGASVPFEFYDQIQVKTGAYSAEYGRSTGGVINAVTKRGGNQFEFGAVSYFNPDWLQGTSPDTYRNDGTLYDRNRVDESTSWTVDIYASGPVIKDRLFFFVLYQPQDFESTYMDGGDTDTLQLERIEDDFWGGNLTWNITDYHSLSLTAFTDKRSIVSDSYNYDADSGARGDLIGDSTSDLGGDSYIASYNGQIGDNLSLSGTYGLHQYRSTRLSSNDLDCPVVVDFRESAASMLPGCWINFTGGQYEGQRTIFRADLAYSLDNHTLRIGFDGEDRESDSNLSLSGFNWVQDLPGGVYYAYQTWNVGDQLANGAIIPDINGDGSPVDIIRYMYHTEGGIYDSDSHAWYLEDTWQLNDAITLGIGLRNEVFKNYNADGDEFLKVEDQWAPRLAFSWAPGGSADHTVNLNWGRYHLPLTDTPLLFMGSGILFFERYFIDDGQRDPRTAAPAVVDENGIPETGELGETLYRADGSVPDARSVLDSRLEPMYQDEWSVGYERRFDGGWVGGIRYVNRELKSLIEDVNTTRGLETIDFPGATDFSQACFYVMTNPGTDITTYCDIDGELVETYIPGDALGIPSPNRTYKAVELVVEKTLSDRWMLRGSYTWSKTKGNAEGMIKSEINQDDTHLTADFDTPQSMDGAYGYLPNDRRHKLRFWGLYQFNERLTLSATLFAQSGRPINAFGLQHPDGVPFGYDTFYLQQPDGTFEFRPRGTSGRTDWVTQLDLAAIYTIRWGDRALLELSAAVFNLLDADSETSVYERLEYSPRQFKMPLAYQQPRQLRLGAAFRF